MTRTRAPAVAGTFYPADPVVLAADVDALLAAAADPGAAGVPKALIVPHAGYVYSRPVAASGYARIRNSRSRIRRVVILGPVHRVAVRGLALPGVEAFETPLGAVRFKVARRDGAIMNASPEFDDCVRLASEHGRPVKDVQALAFKTFLDR